MYPRSFSRSSFFIMLSLIVYQAHCSASSLSSAWLALSLCFSLRWEPILTFWNEPQKHLNKAFWNELSRYLNLGYIRLSSFRLEQWGWCSPSSARSSSVSTSSSTPRWWWEATTRLSHDSADQDHIRASKIASYLLQTFSCSIPWTQRSTSLLRWTFTWTSSTSSYIFCRS